MKMPSPDSVLVEAADALLAVPQRRGVPLPLLLVPLNALPPIACLAVAASMYAIGGLMVLLIPMWLVMAVTGARLAQIDTRFLRSEAEGWGSSRATAWRARSLVRRFHHLAVRSILTVVPVLWPASITIGTWLDGVPAWKVTFHFAAVAAFAATTLAVLYGRCALPRDPDLRAPVPSMA